MLSSGVRDVFGQKKPKSTVLLAVEGMTCQGCVGRLERTVKGAAPEAEVQVTLAPGSIRFTGELSEAEVAALVQKAGFTPHPIA